MAYLMASTDVSAIVRNGMLSNVSSLLVSPVEELCPLQQQQMFSHRVHSKIDAYLC
jgi:hypothetical protein